MVQKATGQLTIYDQNDPIIAGAAPASPAVNALWMDNAVTPNMLKRWNGSNWIPVGALDPNYSTVIADINQDISDLSTTLDTMDLSGLYKVELHSSNGLGFKNGNVATTITATVYQSKTNITGTLAKNQFIWTKTDIDGTPDAAWNTAHATSGASFALSAADIDQLANIACAIDIP